MRLYPLVGSITMWPADLVGGQPPVGYLVADGSSVLRATYPDLYAVYGTYFGAVDGDHFTLPDLRGQFIRFQDAGAGRDTDAGSRTPASGGVASGVGSKQVSAVRSHFHNYTNYLYTPFNPARPATGNTLNPAESYISDPNTGATELRPTNKSVVGLIKY